RTADLPGERPAATRAEAAADDHVPRNDIRATQLELVWPIRVRRAGDEAIGVDQEIRRRVDTDVVEAILGMRVSCQHLPAFGHSLGRSDFQAFIALQYLRIIGNDGAV